MEKTKSCKRKMRIAIGILLLEFAYMLFMGIGGVHATDEALPTVDGKLIHSINHVEITSEMMNRYAKDMDPDIINRITEGNGSCTPQEFLRAYTEQDPKFKKTLEKKYDNFLLSFHKLGRWHAIGHFPARWPHYYNKKGKLLL